MVAPHAFTVDETLDIAKDYIARHHPDAGVVFIGGSILRGEGTPYSDVDMTIIYPHVEKAYRHSLVWQGLPLEYFVHDPETLAWTLDSDYKRNRCTQPHLMLSAHSIVNDPVLAEEVLKMARAILERGPRVYTPDEIDNLRYHLTDAADDLRAPRSVVEMQASAYMLYATLEEAFFAFHKDWHWGGKWLPRKADAHDAGFVPELLQAYRDVGNGNAVALIALIEKLLHKAGGPLWEGLRKERPADARRPV